MRAFETFRLRCDVPGCTNTDELENTASIGTQARELGWGQSKVDEYSAVPPRDMCPEHNPFWPPALVDEQPLQELRDAFEDTVAAMGQEPGQ